MKSPVSRLAIVGAVVVGFCIPFILFPIALSFHVREHTWTAEFFTQWLPALLCPACLWHWEGNLQVFLIAPIVNAGFYGAGVCVYLVAKARCGAGPGGGGERPS